MGGKCQLTSWPFLRLDCFLHGLVREIQRWATTKVGAIKDQLLMAHALIQWLDVAQEHRQLTRPESVLRKRSKMSCLGLAALECTMARQHSRVRHLAKGDANTAYFHLIARGRKRRQFILSLSIAGHTIFYHDDMEQGLFDHFVAVYD